MSVSVPPCPEFYSFKRWVSNVRYGHDVEISGPSPHRFALSRAIRAVDKSRASQVSRNHSWHPG